MIDSPQDNLSRDLLEVVQQLVTELRSGRGRTPALTLDSSLDTDAGLDSLGRVELISRLEQRFNIVLPQKVFAEAETPRDLLRAVTSARGRDAAYLMPEVGKIAGKRIKNIPSEAKNLIEMLQWHVQNHPDRVHIRILGDEQELGALTYKELWDGAARLAAGLQQRGAQSGETVAIMLPTGKNYFFSFFAILLIGAIPVPIYPPLRRSQLEEHLTRHSRILNNSRSALLITVPEAKAIARLLKSQVESLRDITTVDDLGQYGDRYVRPVIASNDIAFLQYTSGSTGNPKGVVLTHVNLLSNIRAMGRAIKADSSDVFVSWLPLYHDMGLIGAWLGSLYFAITFVVMAPLTFLTRPQRWLWAMHHYRGTLSAAPNFGYELLLKRLDDEDLEQLDLSCWRCAFNGAEPVSPETIQRFGARLESTGFKTQTMMPVYGLAEASVGLVFSPLHEEPRIDCIQRDLFSHTRRAKRAKDTDTNALRFVSCGQSLPGHQVRIVDDDGKEREERCEGRLQFRGPSATTGYYRNPDASKELFTDGWLNTGDLAYMADGYLYVTGRSKDVIIRAGRNIYPQEVEEAVGNLKGVRQGCVVAFGTIEPDSGTERLVLIAETGKQEDEDKRQLEKEITEIANDLIGLPPDEVIIAPPHTVLKTSSGKIRRSACRESYERSELGQTQAPIWLQFTRSALRSLLPGCQHLRQMLSNSLFALYAWLLFYLLAATSWTAVVMLPVLAWRWAVIRRISTLLATLTGTPLSVHGLHHLPDPSVPCVYVANHCSYLDGMVMVATIPRIYRNVAKAELQQNFIARRFLNKMGVEYVERFDKERGLIDAQRIAASARHQQSLFFFPEGTFQSIPGLLDFRMGAFLTAAHAGLPVVPIAIRGSRSILRGNSRLPKRGRITVTIGAAINYEELAQGENKDNWTLALKLREEARKHILKHCGEPDLAQAE